MGLIISAELNIKQRGLRVFPVPKETSKQENIRIATTMIDVFQTIDQAHNYSR